MSKNNIFDEIDKEMKRLDLTLPEYITMLENQITSLDAMNAEERFRYALNTTPIPRWR